MASQNLSRLLSSRVPVLPLNAWASVVQCRRQRRWLCIDRHRCRPPSLPDDPQLWAAVLPMRHGEHQQQRLGGAGVCRPQPEGQPRRHPIRPRSDPATRQPPHPLLHRTGGGAGLEGGFPGPNVTPHGGHRKRLVDIITKLGLQKSSVIRHMGSVIQPLLEKGIVDYSIVHTALVEYFTIADRSSAADVIQQLIPRLLQESAVTDDAGQDSAPQFSRKRKYKRNKLRVPLVVRMMRTREGLKIGILCFKHATANVS